MSATVQEITKHQQKWKIAMQVFLISDTVWIFMHEYDVNFHVMIFFQDSMLFLESVSMF